MSSLNTIDISMRRITSIAPVALGLLALVLSTSSCNSKRKVELEDFQLYNSQITGFALSTADKDMKEALAKAAFVIRNTETGRIYNPQALPYSSKSYDLSLRIQSATQGAEIEVITADGKTTKWTGEKQTFKSDALLHGIQLRVSTKDRSGQLQSYTYKVTFKRYREDPHTFSWSEASVSGLPVFSSAFSTVMTSGDGGTMYYVKPSGASAASTFASPTASWQDASLTGIPAGERFTSVVSYGGKLYATTSASKLYEGSGVSFATKTLSGDYSPSLILGGLKIDGVPSLTLVGANAAGSKAFLTYGIASSSVTHIGEAPDGAFPSSGETISYELTGGNYQGNALYLAGGITASGKASPNLWSTTNGHDWLIVGGKITEGKAITAQTLAYVPSQKRIYRFASTAEGLELYISSDNGRSWESARTTAFSGLTLTDFAGYPLQAFPSADGETIYLLRGAKSSGESAKLFVGKFGGLKTIED